MRKSSKETQQFYYQIKNQEVGENYSPLNETEILTPDEKAIADDLTLEYKKVMTNFESFLNTEYVKFDYKMNSCMVKRCYSDIFQPREQIRKCSEKCQEGLPAINEYVSKLTNEIKVEVDNCLNAAQIVENEIMTESFKCYKNAIDRFGIMKKMISQELSYYKS